MRKVVGIKEAAAHTGLAPWELRTGANAGRYPHMRSGGSRGKILFDLELLEAAITRQMLANATQQEGSDYSGKIRALPVSLAK